MNNKNKVKRSISLFFLIAFLLNASSALAATLSVSPLAIDDPSLTVGKNFTVNVRIDNVSSLYGFEFRLYWNKSMIEFVNATAYPKNLWSSSMKWNDGASDYYIASYSAKYPSNGFTGNSSLVALRFKVIGIGNTTLSIQGARLGDALARKISYDVKNGYFNNKPNPLPDFIIDNAWYSGRIIYYKIRNQGNANAGYSYSKLFVDGSYKAYDYVPALSAGYSSNEYFSYSWTCSAPSDIVQVCADGWNYVSESNENNNCMTKTFAC